MQRLISTTIMAFIVSGSTSVLGAGEVAVKGIHLCCPSCLRAVEGALDRVDGVSGVAADRDSKLVTFQAASPRAAQAGITALADAGFHGKATFDGRPLAFPASGAKPGAKADSFMLGGVHVCCAACVTSIHKALAELDGVSVIDINKPKRTVKLSGSEIDVSAAVRVLNASGFHTTVAK